MNNKYMLLISAKCIIVNPSLFARGKTIVNAGTVNITSSSPKCNIENSGQLNISDGELSKITNTENACQSSGQVDEVENSGMYNYNGGNISQFTQQDEGRFDVNSDLTVSGNFDLKKGSSILAEGTAVNVTTNGVLDVDISKTYLNGTVNVEKGAMNVFGCNSETEHTLKHTDDEATTNINNTVETNIPEPQARKKILLPL